MYDTVVLGSGGIRGLAILGGFYELQMNHVIDSQKIKNYAGISIGAVLALFLSMNYDIRTIYHMFHERLPRRLRVLSILSDFGLDDGSGLDLLLREHMHDMYDITFEQHYEKYGKGLYIQATNLNLLKAEIYSHTSHPQMLVREAIRRSVSIPLFFKPVLCQSTNHHFLDGALIGDHQLISLFHPEKTLVIQIKPKDSTHTEKLTSFPTFFQQIITLLLNQVNLSDKPLPRRMQISFDVLSQPHQLFSGSPEQLRQLWWQGRKQVASEFAQAYQSQSDEIADHKEEVK